MIAPKSNNALLMTLTELCILPWICNIPLCARATIATMLYVAPVLWGFAGEGDRLEHLITRMRRIGCLSANFPDFTNLAEYADYNLFYSIRRNKTHVLRHYFVEKPIPISLLHVRAHNLVLPPRDNGNFVSRALYKALGLSNAKSPLHN